MKNSLCLELLEVIEKQDEIIKKEKLLIKKLVEDNAEKENMINELLKQNAASKTF